MPDKTSLEEQLAQSVVKGRSPGKTKRFTRQFGSFLSSGSKKRTSKGMSSKNISSSRTEY